jgi:hypothetical protein
VGRWVWGIEGVGAMWRGAMDEGGLSRMGCGIAGFGGVPGGGGNRIVYRGVLSNA